MENEVKELIVFRQGVEGLGRSGRGDTSSAGLIPARAQGARLDKSPILLQSSIGVLEIEGASLEPPYISILESGKLRI